MQDSAHIKTEKELARLEKEIKTIYTNSINEMNEEMEKLISKMSKEKDPKKLYNMLQKQKRFESLIADMTETLNNSNKIAVDIMNDKLIEIYALNSNYMNQFINKNANIDLNFTLYNKQIIKELLKKNANAFELLALDNLKDKKVIYAALRRELMISIMQGESMQEIAERIAKIGNAKYNDFMRIAITEVTRIQNLARLDSMLQAEKEGLNLRKVWIATGDRRTRQTHLKISGEMKKLNEKFGNGLEYPGDPQGHSSEVIRCRCTMTTEIIGVSKNKKEKELDKRITEKIGGFINGK